MPLQDSSSSSDSKDDEGDGDETVNTDAQDNFDNKAVEDNDEMVAAGAEEIMSNKVEHNIDYNIDSRA